MTRRLRRNLQHPSLLALEKQWQAIYHCLPSVISLQRHTGTVFILLIILTAHSAISTGHDLHLIAGTHQSASCQHGRASPLTVQNNGFVLWQTICPPIKRLKRKIYRIREMPCAKGHLISQIYDHTIPASSSVFQLPEGDQIKTIVHFTTSPSK